MAYLVTLQVLLDEESAERADCVVLEAIGHHIAKAGVEDNVIIDYRTTNVAPVASVIDDSIANEVYASGDVFHSLIAYRHADGEGQFWSNIRGWGPYYLAMRFPVTTADLPEGADDGVFLIDYGPEEVFAQLKKREASKVHIPLKEPQPLHSYLVKVVDTKSQAETPWKCFAEDDEHAISQAKDHFPYKGTLFRPAVRIDHWPASARFVVFSLSEAHVGGFPDDPDSIDVPGYWSNESGWGLLASASVFTEEEMATFSLPMAVLNDATWVPLGAQRRAV